MVDSTHGLLAWQALMAALVGGALALAGSFFAKRWEYNHQRKAVRAAFGAEINGLFKLAGIRQHEAVAASWIARWEAGEDYRPQMFGVPPDEDPIYIKNADKIGLLGSEAADVVLFYTLIRAIRVHLRVVQSGQIMELALPQRIVFARQALGLWKQALPLADSLAVRLKP